MLRRLKHHIYQFIGGLSLGLGVLGAFLPLLPTTCFILLAAWAFSKSSPRFYRALCNHSLFGGIIRDWQTHRAMSIKTKVIASLSIVASFSLTLLLVSIPTILMWGLLILMAVLMICIALINTKQPHALSPKSISH